MTGGEKVYGTKQPIRWRQKDWDDLQKVAQSLGISRSEFIRGAALKAAEAVQAGSIPYFVDEAKDSLQNMGASFFRPEGDQKIDCGAGNSASPGRGAIAKQRATVSGKKRSV
jgi:hypothetical protein